VKAGFCDDRGAHGFSWVVDEPMTRTSHALAADGRVWLVDPVDWPDAIDRATALGRPAAVLQLLDRHNRDCAAVAMRLGIPHLLVPPDLPDSPFAVVEVLRRKRWHEVALWWEATRTLVVAEAVGTNPFFTGDAEGAGVHLLLRLTPPRGLAAFAPEHLLVGHGVGRHGAAATSDLREAISHSRRGLPRLLVRAPALALDARRRRRATA
jgi:hypothetical protein